MKKELENFEDVQLLVRSFYSKVLNDQMLAPFSKLEKKNFERWLELFNQTLDELFIGEKVELAKQRALSIATMMQIKILQPDEQINGNKMLNL